jgi:hypothetical protein
VWTAQRAVRPPPDASTSRHRQRRGSTQMWPPCLLCCSDPDPGRLPSGSGATRRPAGFDKEPTRPEPPPPGLAMP